MQPPAKPKTTAKPPATLAQIARGAPIDFDHTLRQIAILLTRLHPSMAAATLPPEPDPDPEPAAANPP